MRKTIFTAIATGTMALFLVSACAEDKKVSEAVVTPAVAVSQDGPVESDQVSPIMDQPVNFSTPEEVEKSLQKVREQGGEKAYKNLEGSMKYMLYRDLSLKGSQEKMYEKLDGKTPTQIIAMAKR